MSAYWTARYRRSGIPSPSLAGYATQFPQVGQLHPPRRAGQIVPVGRQGLLHFAQAGQHGAESRVLIGAALEFPGGNGIRVGGELADGPRRRGETEHLVIRRYYLLAERGLGVHREHGF